MQVYSHSRENDNGQRWGSKLLINHLSGVRNKACARFSGRVQLTTGDSISPENLLDIICWLHDLGKYTGYFQTYLLKSEKVDSYLKSHSALGANTAYQYLKEHPRSALLAFYLIKMHHSNLLNPKEVVFPENHRNEAYYIEQQIANLKDFSELKQSLTEFRDDHVTYTSPKELFGIYKKQIRKNPSVELYFLVNYLFSLLIEADKLDATDTAPYEMVSISENAVDQRPELGKPDYPQKSLDTFNQNELRNFVRSEVNRNLNEKQILNKRLFTLAAPTGIGKTLTSLDFTLKLRKRIEDEEGYRPQIIYGLPFINIIEQALEEYHKTIPEGKIIGHYQYADIFGSDEAEADTPDDTERNYVQKLMTWDTWQSDVVITSFVQLFETLIGHRNKLLKKFHHFADAIIILDEVQTLPMNKIPVVTAALYYLCKYLNARVLIMTATQPRLFDLMQRELPVEINEEGLKPYNLLPRDNEVFARFDRTKIIPQIDHQIENEDFPELFDMHWEPDKSCLIVVNKVKRSIALFELLKDQFADSGEVELFYLSTNITPADRQRRITEIKASLPEKTCILVATQVVEAGVDLDFDMGFRDLGPIDSIVQVAGRINRENAAERLGSPLYVVDFGDCRDIYGFATDSKSRDALNRTEIPERDFKTMVERYFEEVSDPRYSDFEDSREIFEAMRKLRYGSPRDKDLREKSVSDFRIIDQSNKGISVFIEQAGDEEATSARKAFRKLQEGKLSKMEFDKHHKRAFNQRIIAVPNYLPAINDLRDAEPLFENILWVQPEMVNYFYNVDTGFIRDQEQEPGVVSF